MVAPIKIAASFIYIMLMISCNKIEKIENIKLDYPTTKQVTHFDTYHGTIISDSFQWMEDYKSEEVKSWAKKQDSLTQSYIDESPIRSKIEKRIETIGDFESYGIPIKKGKYYFFTKSPKKGLQSIVYVQESLETEPRILLDPNSQIKDKTMRFGGFSASFNGKYISYHVAKNQSRWGSLKLIHVKSGKVLDDSITGLRTSTTIWTQDSKGFFYAKYGNIEKLESKVEKPFAQIYYHKLGTNQKEDVLVYDNPNQSSWVYNINLTDDGKHIIISQGIPSNPNNRVFYKSVKETNNPVNNLINDFNDAYTFLGNDGSLWWFQTNKNAPNSKIIGIDITKPEQRNWIEIVPEQKETLNSARVIGNQFVLSYLKDAREKLKIYTLNGDFEYDLDILDLGGRYGGFNGNRNTSETFFMVGGSYDPGTTYRLDLKTGKYTLFLRPELSFNPDDFVTKQVFYKSLDGATIPMTITHKKGIKLNKKNPVFMYAFGSAGWSAYVWFQPHIVTWMEMGGIYALPNIRGGGEYGSKWMEAGIKKNKQNAINDYIGAAEWLIENNYTSNSLMVLNGGSSSGILPGAALNQRPNLFGAVIIDIPFLDMLRYHNFTLWEGWKDGFGVSSELEEFKVLKSYSPYHNIASENCYPPTLVSVGENDQGAVPIHGYKYIAKLQSLQDCNNPTLLKVI